MQQSERLRPARKPDDVRRSVHMNLENLGVDKLDLVNLRRGDTGEVQRLTKLSGLARQQLFKMAHSHPDKWNSLPLVGG